jgi:predicted ferric reductase
MRLNEHIWWYLSRASGLVSWLALAASCALGILLATRVLKPYDRPAWLLSVHRYLSAIFLATLAVHLGGLALDGYVKFAWRELFIPGESSWKTTGVALGVVAMYVALVVEATSLMMRRLPRRVWHAIHLLSYVSFVLVSVHAIQVGTDVRTQVFAVALSGFTGVLVLFAGVRLLHLRTPPERPMRTGRPQQ